MNNPLFGEVDNYISSLVAPEDEALQATIQSIDASGIPSISVSAVQGKFLQVLAKLCQAKKILEIGTLAGYSTIWMARALPRDGKLISLEYEPLHASIAAKNIAHAGLSEQVEIRVGKALDLLPQIEKENAGPFDMIFIDADKLPYAEYFQWALKLSRSGTLIVADNVIREGKVLQEGYEDEMVQGVQRFNKLLAATSGVTASIMQTIGAKDHDGIAIVVVN